MFRFSHFNTSTVTAVVYKWHLLLFPENHRSDIDGFIFRLIRIIHRQKDEYKQKLNEN